MCSKLWRKDLRNHFLSKVKLDTASSNYKETSEWIISVWRGNYNQCVNLSRTFWIMFLEMLFMIRYPSETVVSLFPDYWTGESGNTTQEQEELGGLLKNVCKSSIPVKMWNWQYKLISPGYWLLLISLTPLSLILLYWVKYFLTLIRLAINRWFRSFGMP